MLQYEKWTEMLKSVTKYELHYQISEETFWPYEIDHMISFFKKYWSVVFYLATFWCFQKLMQTNILITQIAHIKPEQSIFYRLSQFRIILAHSSIKRHKTCWVKCVEGRLHTTLNNETAFNFNILFSLHEG